MDRQSLEVKKEIQQTALQLRHGSTLASNRSAYFLQHIVLPYLPAFSPIGGKQRGRHGDGGFQKLGVLSLFFLELGNTERHTWAWNIYTLKCILQTFLELIFHPTQCSNFHFSSINSQTPVLADTNVLSSVLTKGARLNVLDKNVLHALTLLQLQTDLLQTSKSRFSS